MKSLGEVNQCRWFERLNERNTPFSNQKCIYPVVGVGDVDNLKNADMFTCELRECPL